MVGAALAMPVPVLGGDWPDPSFIRDADGYTAVTTSGSWSPSFRILRSDDLRTWRLAGSVFRRPPRWARTKLWAPELTRLRGRFAIFYSALPREGYSALPREGRSWYCLGVATASAPAGPYRDRGRPLRCSKHGSIDPFTVRDERGRLHLLWKEDGNAFGRPTPILAQRLSEDGRRLRGRPRELIRNTAPWEGRVVEAPTVIRRDGLFYMFYSANLCCTPRCAYAVGIARSHTLLGPWEKFSANPILRDGNGWRCPGHLSIVPEPDGQLKTLFHAYRSGAGVLAGRQLLVDEVSFDADGWPRIGTGLPAPSLPGAPSPGFEDTFAGPWLALEWEWPTERPPRVTVRSGLRLAAGRRGGRRIDAAVLSRRVGTDRYVATTVVARRALRGSALAGLAAYGPGAESIGVAVGRRRLIVWQHRNGRRRLLVQASPPQADSVHLKLRSLGRRVLFEVSADGSTWQPLGAERLTPIEESARVALTVGGRRGAVARFARVGLAEEP
jgi:beta-xylosidase